MTVTFRGEGRSNQTHESKTDHDALLARKGAGKEAKWSYSGNLLVENRNGLIVSSGVGNDEQRERDAAMVMLQQLPGNRSGHRGPATPELYFGLIVLGFLILCIETAVLPQSERSGFMSTTFCRTV
jgi:hypothetical protein